MNMYGRSFGFHTPAATQRLAELLTSEGIKFFDYTYHNDELDRLCVPLTEEVDLMLWVGDVSHPQEDYHISTIWRANKDEEEIDDGNYFTGTHAEIVAKVKQLLNK